MLKKRLVSFAVAAGVIAGLAPMGALPAQANCESDVIMWFWYGFRVEYSQATNPVNGVLRDQVNPALRDNPVSQAIRDNTGQEAPQPQLAGRSSVVGPPANTSTTTISCDVARDTAAVSMNNPVLPGATMTSARDNGAPCEDRNGAIVGLGAGPTLIGAGGQGDGVGLHWAGGQGDFRVWTFERDVVTGGCTSLPGQQGAATPTIPIDPTQLGTIRAWTDRSGEAGAGVYTTIDR